MIKLPQIIDLTHSISSSIPSWNGHCGFTYSKQEDHGVSENLFTFRVQEVEMQAGAGTHIDAPAHCFRNGKAIGDIPIGDLFSPSVVINISDRANENFSLTVEDIKLWEKTFTPISEGHLVIIRTGWDQYFSDADRYRNNLQFPSISEDAGSYLLSKGIAGIGVDTLSPDLPESGFPIHRIFLEAGKHIIENIANAALLPPVGAYTLALPLKLEGGTEAPVRFVGFLGFENEF